jgi:hypothetical protein
MLFFFMLALAESSSPNCPKYSCKSGSQSFSEGTCVYYSNSTGYDRYTTLKCPKTGINTYCNIVIGANSTCVPPPAPAPRLPGEECNATISCAQNLACNMSACNDPKNCMGKCQGAVAFSKCDSTDQCDVGLFCKNELCVAQIEIFSNTQECTDDSQCVNNAGCNGTVASPGLCVGYFNISDYDYVASCTNNQSLLCNSGYCVNYQNANRCFGSATNNRPNPYVCSKNDCRSYNDDNLGDLYIPGTCTCGYNSERTMVCSIFNQDKESTRYFSLLNDWYTGTDITKCHTSARGNSECISKSTWNDRLEFIYRRYKVPLYQYLYFADDCVTEVFLQDYWAAKHAYSASLVLVLGLATLGLI